MDAWLQNFKLSKNKDPKPKPVQENPESDGGSCSHVGSFGTDNANACTETKSNILLPEFKRDVRNDIILKNYPKKDGRSFQGSWLRKFEWLEYHPQKDAAFCFACRFFPTSENKEVTFTINGFRNWKNAMDKRNGFPSHESSNSHKVCMTKWNQRKLRGDQQLEISTLVNENVLVKHRYYISAIFDCIKFLVVNELPLRGTYSKEEHRETGLFQALFQYTQKKDKELANCVNMIPKNALYTSGEIQNEIIEIMARCVKNQVSAEVTSADVPFYCIMADGTRDRNNNEAFSIAIRFVRNGIPIESLVSIEDAQCLTAEYLTKLILNTVDENGIERKSMLSQCYDGAAVMSGNKGGIQKLIEESLGRPVPYIHCFNHQLHLIVVDVVKTISEVKQYFDYCRIVHHIFSTFKFKSYYDGKRTSRLLEQRWTGHLKVTEIIHDNYNVMIEALNSAIVDKSSGHLDGDKIVECSGLLAVMKTLQFRFVNCAMLKLLKTIEPADKILQSRERGLASSLPVINSVFGCIKQYRTESTYDEIFNQCTSLLPLPDDEGEGECLVPMRRSGSKRKRKPNEKYNDFVLTESSGLYHNSDDPNCKQIYFAIMDKVIVEMEERFIKNHALYNLIDKVYHLSVTNIEELKELKKYDISIPCQEELVCVKRYLEENAIVVENYLSELYKQKTAFRETYEMYAACAVFACSSAICEVTFSYLNRILTFYRQTMLFGREANLTLLPFEKKKTENIDINTFLRMLNEKSRRLQLF